MYLGRTTEVGSYASNAWGLYDMDGNVVEWCQDWYGMYPVGPVTNPTGPETGNWRMNRGGNWRNGAYLCRSAWRGEDRPDDGDNRTGFRVVLGHPYFRDFVTGGLEFAAESPGCLTSSSCKHIDRAKCGAITNYNLRNAEEKTVDEWRLGREGAFRLTQLLRMRQWKGH